MDMRSLLTENICRLVKNQADVALSFSGGTDSLAMLFSCLMFGIRPPLYTYCVEGQESGDLQRARWAADTYHLPLTIGWIPTDLAFLMDDVVLMAHHGIRGKVSFQCMHGHYRLAPLVTQHQILNGSGIDGIYGVYRECLLGPAKKDHRTFNRVRQKHLDNPNDDAMLYQRLLYARYNVEVLYPYRQPNIIQFLMSKSWEEINRPKFKAITTSCYPEFQQTPGLWRPRGSQQIIAGTRALHDRLIDSPLNTRNRLRVDEVYKDVVEQEKSCPQPTQAG